MKLGIIGAMDIEIDSIIKNITNYKIRNIANRSFYEGNINNISLIIVKSGIGLVNAAITTQILIDKYSPDYIINTGIAGSLKENVKLFDVVISTSCIQYEFDLTCFGYDLGQIPERKNKFFLTSKYLKEKIFSLDLNKKVHTGIVLSADKFLNNENKRNFLAKNFNALCVEMEGASIAHVCEDNGVECIIIRTISDNASSHILYEEIEEKSAKISNDIILKIINTISDK